MPVEPAATPRRCAVLGSPVGHSLSPVLHRAAYAELGLDWSYDAFEVEEDELADFVTGLGQQWRGLSLTMPLKRRIIDLCDQVEDVAAMLASANTVVIDADGARRGFNTDVGGFVDSFTEAGATNLSSVVIVGAGATAASAIAAVAQLGAGEVTVLARSLTRAGELVRLGSRLHVRVDLCEIGAGRSTWESLDADAVVSTIPARAQDRLAERLAGLAPVVFDVIYHPRVTPLIEQARVLGSTVVEGFSLLLHQAGKQVELMTGAASAPLEEMRAAGLAELGNR